MPLDPIARPDVDLVRGILVPRPFGQAIIDVDDALSIEDVAGWPERFYRFGRQPATSNAQSR
jgi:hypothetical protein